MTDQPRPSFSEACGLTGPLELFVRRPGEAGERHCSFEQPFVLVGRDPHADLCLEGEQVSQRHVYLQVVTGHLFCLDLDSRGGTYWDDGRRQSGWLVPGQTIRLGPYEVGLIRCGRSASVPDWSPVATRLPDAAAGVACTIEFVRGEQVETRCRLTRVLTLAGRGPACRLRLSSPEVSRYHCALLRTPAAVWAVDLLGKEGIRVRGARVLASPVGDGDSLKVGEFEMRLRHQTATKALPWAGPTKGGDNAESVRLPATRPLVSSGLAPLPGGLAADASALGPAVHQLRLMQQEMFDQFHQALMMMIQMFGAAQRDQMGLIRDELDRVHALTRELQTLRAKQAGQAPAPLASAGGVGRPGGGGTAAAAGEPPASGQSAGPPPGKATAPAEAPREGEAIHVWLSQRIEALEQEQQSRWQKVMSLVLGK